MNQTEKCSTGLNTTPNAVKLNDSSGFYVIYIKETISWARQMEYLAHLQGDVTLIFH